MAKITRTYGPIHFEDLDPHRFEDLIRELIYDYKDWQSIEATGRGGTDAGFDIRAYERISAGQTVAADPEDAEEQHPMTGNRWMVQCKREKDIGPKKLLAILDDVDGNDPPYGYILAAATNFSKQSYDAFRAKLVEKGVMEFYLWGKAELEDMLHQPKNDRILFTFFGISLVTRRRSRSTEIRFKVNNKNKLFRVLGEEIGHSSVLLRDANDEHYPYSSNYKDFDKYPRWKEFEATEYHAHGLVAKIAKRFAYIDRDKKEYDYTDHASLIFRQSDPDNERREQQDARELVEDYWDHLPNRHKAYFCEAGLVHFDAMLVIDDKGIEPHKFPHIFVEFSGNKGPFAGFFRYLEVSRGYGEPQTFDIRDWKRVKIFPATFPEPSVGAVHQEGAVQLDSDTHRMVVNGNDSVREFYDLDGKYDSLKPRDVITLKAEKGNSPTYLQITNARSVTVKEFLTGPDKEFRRQELERRIGRDLSDSDALKIFEFKRTYDWRVKRAGQTIPD
jgi:hypothetical protein